MDIIITCLLLALILYFFEIFVPGGICFGIGTLLMVIASVVAYRDFGALAGVITFCFGGSLAVAFLYVELKWIPRTAIGRRLLIHDNTLQGNAAPIDAKQDLVGSEGITITRLNPLGSVKIHDQACEAVSRAGMLPAGTHVRVVAQDAFRVVVEPQ